MNENSAQKSIGMTMACRVWRWAKAHPMLALLAYVVLVSAIFLWFPQIDIWASSLFYKEGAGFVAEQNAFLQKLRHLGPYLVKWIAIGAVAVLLLKLLLPNRAPLLPLRVPTFLVSTLILGPGILVNSILKDNWGRPRPRSIEEFAGDLPHQMVWVPSNYCGSNCSFVSGEASASIWLVGVALILPAAWRKAALLFTLPLCVILSVNRVAFGGHFLSDTLLSWGLTLMVIFGVHWLLFKAPFHPTDKGMDASFTKGGLKLHAWAKAAFAVVWRSLCSFGTRFQDRS